MIVGFYGKMFEGIIKIGGKYKEFVDIICILINSLGRKIFFHVI